MDTNLFDFCLPLELIAQQPAARRDAARMLVLDRSRPGCTHTSFVHLPDWLHAGDLIVVNDTQVIPARFWGHKDGTGGKIEFLALEEISPGLWEVLMRTRRRPSLGASIVLGNGSMRGRIEKIGAQGIAYLRIEGEKSLLALLDADGVPPLPPYITRKTSTPAQTQADRERYQTVFARHPGAVAAPTAGLHFTQEVVRTLQAKGIDMVTITLHVGPGTFRPVTAERLEDHSMHSERYTVSENTATRIRETKAAGGRVVAVGSTSVRTLESVAQTHGEIVATQGRTCLFIHPPYRFRVVDAMLTNFHLPRSSLIMMVSALAGRERILDAYAEAIQCRYRFYSYGDCMLIV
jgi:S-adenosylmethionine:tRNA ribosyltransferase-isomerase